MSGGSLPGLDLRRPGARCAPAAGSAVADSRSTRCAGSRARIRARCCSRTAARTRSSRGRRWSPCRRRLRTDRWSRWYPAGHELNAQVYRDQLAFLAKKLPIDGPQVPGTPEPARRSLYTRRVAEARRERKVVTVLFADLVGFTSRAEQLDPEDVAARARPLPRARPQRARALRRHGREVHRRRGDGALRRADRARGRPRAGGPRRAARSASGRRGQGVEVRIGVNTGEALVTRRRAARGRRDDGRRRRREHGRAAPVGGAA